ncbi:MAG: ribonuclease Y [Acidimicrobiia bacterium]|nr:ribonuclease Y [Acidimicrobiia bacterium]
MDTALLVLGAVGLVSIGFLGSVLLVSRRLDRPALDSDAVDVEKARRKAQRILSRAEEEGQARAQAYREREEALLDQRKLETVTAEDRLIQRERTLEQRASNLAQREQMLIDREAGVSKLQGEMDDLTEQARSNLERISTLNAQTAREELVEQVREEARREAMLLVRDSEIRAREEADRRARRILATAIQRMASDVVQETTVTTVSLPEEEMKGRIIGREGRNIRSFESVTGVNLEIDETPGTVVLSCFDPVRREIARITLEKLIADGRIHPSAIEELYAKAKTEVENSVRDAGEWAVVNAGVARVHPELVTLIGRLKYRTSYGQNVLDHLVETAHIAGMLGAEMGVDPAPIKRAAFLHDIGKAVTHHIEGPHALIGAEIARRFGEEAGIVHGIEAHHNDVEPRTLGAVIVQAADTVSAARPGARRAELESYVRRLERMEDLIGEFDGVDRVYAMQAGREVRVAVDPDVITDLEAADLVRRISRRLESDVRYPGQIEVTVIRELRITDYAR